MTYGLALHNKTSMEDLVKEATRKVLRKFKFDFALKAEQENVVHHLIKGNDVFALLPTGFGKSMCYIMMPLIMSEVSF